MKKGERSQLYRKHIICTNTKLHTFSCIEFENELTSASSDLAFEVCAWKECAHVIVTSQWDKNNASTRVKQNKLQPTDLQLFFKLLWSFLESTNLYIFTVQLCKLVSYRHWVHVAVSVLYNKTSLFWIPLEHFTEYCLALKEVFTFQGYIFFEVLL